MGSTAPVWSNHYDDNLPIRMPPNTRAPNHLFDTNLQHNRNKQPYQTRHLYIYIQESFTSIRFKKNKVKPVLSEVIITQVMNKCLKRKGLWTCKCLCGSCISLLKNYFLNLFFFCLTSINYI